MFDSLKEILSLVFVIPLVFFLGAYLSIKLRWLQFTSLKEGLLGLFQAKSTKSTKSTKTEGSLSSFAALSAVLGGNLGTGNIAGVAVALSMGGPGSLFWMWIMALLGSIVKFAGCYLGVSYRIKHPRYGWLGGPMYYLANVLQWNKLAKLYCVFTLISAFTVGNLVQINSVALPIAEMGGSAIITAVVMMIVVGLVLVGGVSFFSAISATIVPFIAAVYLIACLWIIASNSQQLIPSVQLIFSSAFTLKPLVGGAAGFLIFDALRVGFDRGLFATDAGLGLAAILHSQVEGEGQELRALARMQGLITMVAPIIVMFICTLTGLVLLMTGAWQVAGVASTNMCIAAFQIGFGANSAAYLVIFTMLLFSFTTILTWAHCAERVLIFLADAKWLVIFRWSFILTIPLGVFCQVYLVWTVADIAINLMLLVNILAIIRLAPEIIKSRNFLRQKASPQVLAVTEE